MTTTIPATRVRLRDEAPKPYAAMYNVERSIGLDRGLRELIKLRASQINGCAFCVDMHWKNARKAGESEERLYMLAAWRESPLYTLRERAALALCEAITTLAHGESSERVWDEVRAAFEDDELAQIIFQIASINAWNRLMIVSGAEPGHYRPGDFAPRER